ncbi:phosphoserine phosphatase [Corynebacterium atypicum]|uniref:Phosphoserine phosphatase n=1 Tax=Corynebacterium atypicum TaxID=191610 RepID=A0ABM5QL97_9CORY|nr:HAD family hydrolase [Corynebacterium atypicum]AIG63549.1 phosphoserine phosphatase [Corynebacterium atypicum]
MTSTPHGVGRSLRPRPSGRVAAFFDLDKTIIATSSTFAFGREFLHKGMITPVEALQMTLAKTTFMISGMSGEQMDTTRDQLTNLISGWQESDVRKITEETLHTVLVPTIYAEARELIRFHQQAGHDVIIVSASAEDLVRPIAQELGVYDVVATQLEVKDGRYTGEILRYNKGASKAASIAKLAQSRHYDLSASYAYTDSDTDSSMLSAVGNPVAVNPDRMLKKRALKEGWEIRTFKNPEPLFTAPTAREVGIGTGIVAAIAAVTAGGWWWSKRRDLGS